MKGRETLITFWDCLEKCANAAVRSFSGLHWVCLMLSIFYYSRFQPKKRGTKWRLRTSISKNLNKIVRSFFASWTSVELNRAPCSRRALCSAAQCTLCTLATLLSSSSEVSSATNSLILSRSRVKWGTWYLLFPENAVIPIQGCLSLGYPTWRQAFAFEWQSLPWSLSGGCQALLTTAVRYLHRSMLYRVSMQQLSALEAQQIYQRV